MKMFFYNFLLLGCLLVSSTMYAQEGTIAGMVTDVAGMPIIGATLKIASLSTGARSDANGQYRFNAPAGSYTLQVSYTGSGT